MTYSADVGDLFLQLPEVGTECRDHGFHQQQTPLPRFLGHLSGLSCIGGKRLFAEDMLAFPEAADREVVVSVVRRAYVDSPDGWVRKHFVQV